MGPYLRIQGAVFLDKIIYQAFTECMWLGGNPYLDENIMRIARIFSAAAKAVRSAETCTRIMTAWNLVTFPFLLAFFRSPRSDLRISPVFSSCSLKAVLRI